MARIPYARQRIDEVDIEAVAAVLRSDWLTTGPAVPAFETAFAKAVGADHAVSCSSGTAALHLAALAAGLEEGDYAIVPSITFLATANCNRYVGAEVIFADVNPNNGLMEAQHLDEAVSRAGDRRVKAVYPVHLNGQCADMDAIHALARKHGLTVIEDACHALGSRYTTKDEDISVGACVHSDMAIFSFHPVKTIAAGEGGGVTTGDAALGEQIARLRNHGIVRDGNAFVSHELANDAHGARNPWYYETQELGLNYRLSDIHAALAHSQLGKLGDFCARRRIMASLYDQLLAPLAPLVKPVARTPRCQPVWHLYAVLIDFEKIGLTRAALMHRLEEKGIGTQVHYVPVHMQPYYAGRYGAQELPGARAYYERCLSLPFFPAMTDSDIGRVTETLSECLT